MPVVGIQRVRRNLDGLSKKIAGERTRAAVTEILNAGSAASALITPVDTSNLINSRTKPILRSYSGGVSGSVGYTAKYAHWVHEMPGTLKGKPRAHFGTTTQGVAFGGGTEKGNYWDGPTGPAEPQFLTKGFDKIKPSIPAILKATYGN